MTTTTRSDSRTAPSTPKELFEAEIRAGDMVIDTTTDEWFFVMAVSDIPAGEHELEGELGTVAEWYDCDEDDDVLLCVSYDKAVEKAGIAWEGLDDVLQAVRDRRLHQRALPASDCVPALREFFAARTRGEWDGLAEYIRGGFEDE